MLVQTVTGCAALVLLDMQRPQQAPDTVSRLYCSFLALTSLLICFLPTYYFMLHQEHGSLCALLSTAKALLCPLYVGAL